MLEVVGVIFAGDKCIVKPRPHKIYRQNPAHYIPFGNPEKACIKLVILFQRDRGEGTSKLPV